METTWIFIVIGLFILFFLFSNTIYITASNVQSPMDGCGVSTYGCCKDKITSRIDALGTNCPKKLDKKLVTSPPVSNMPPPSPYVVENVANTTPYPPTSPSTILIPIPIPTSTTATTASTTAATTTVDQPQLPPKAQATAATKP